MRFLLFSLCCVIVLQCARTANIIGLFLVPSMSHHILGEALLRGFVTAGHNVTLVSAFPVKQPPKNFTVIQIPGLIEPFENIKTILQTTKPWTLVVFMKEFHRQFTEIPMESSEMQRLRTSGIKYDILISCEAYNRVFYGLAHELGAQIIPFSPSQSMLVDYLSGNPAPFSFVPNILLPFTDHMTFTERVINTLAGFANTLLRVIIIKPLEETLYNKYFKGLPSLEELTRNISLVFVNSHVSVETPRPYVPNMIQIGGFHVLEDINELPKGIKEFLDSAKQGFIYCSLGSNVKPSMLANEKILAFTKSFSKFPYKVLWKWDTDDIPEISSNVKTQKWLPQKDILAHPNLKVFITHGGLLSTTEAIVNGVPMIGIPFFGDQQLNVKSMTSGGYGIALTVDELSPESLTATIKEITENQKYHESAQKHQSVFLDRPMKPMDTAVYWVEHILRHGGGHLRCAGADLNLVQYYSLDVITFLLILVYVVIKIVLVTCKHCCCRHTTQSKNKLE